VPEKLSNAHRPLAAGGAPSLDDVGRPEPFGISRSRLRVAQPGLSQAIGALERDLGTSLFHRLGREVSLTAAGEALVRPAQQVVRDLATARASVQHVSGLTGGHLDIVALTTLAVDPLAGLVGRFRELYPLVDVKIADPEHDTAVTDMVRTGDSELGLAESPVHIEGLDSLRLADQEFFAVLPPNHKPPRSAPLPGAELATMPLIATPEGTAMRSLVDRALTVRGIPPRVAVETTHRAAIVPLVLAGRRRHLAATGDRAGSRTPWSRGRTHRTSAGAHGSVDVARPPAIASRGRLPRPRQTNHRPRTRPGPGPAGAQPLVTHEPSTTVDQTVLAGHCRHRVPQVRRMLRTKVHVT